MTWTGTVAGSSSSISACPGCEKRKANILGSPTITWDNTDRRAYGNTVDWDRVDEISIPDTAVTQDSMDEHLLTLAPAESRKTPSDFAILVSKGEHNTAANHLVLPQSSPTSPTLSGCEAPPSPSTTLADDESFSSAPTSVDSILQVNEVLLSADPVELNFGGEETKLCSPQATIPKQMSLETVASRKRVYGFQEGEIPFTDSTEYCCNTIGIQPPALNSGNSECSRCIETYLAQSETDWFDRVRILKQGKPGASVPSSSACQERIHHHLSPGDVESLDVKHTDRLARGDGHHTLPGLRRLFLLRIGDWPVYSLSIALVRKKLHWRRIRC